MSAECKCCGALVGVCLNCGTVQESWISVKDRLPEDETETLVLSWGCFHILCYSSEDGWTYDGGREFSADGITHWMLPDLPAKEVQG